MHDAGNRDLHMPRGGPEGQLVGGREIGIRLTHSKNKPGCWKRSERNTERNIEKHLHVNKMLSGFDRVPHRAEEEKKQER